MGVPRTAKGPRPALLGTLLCLVLALALSATAAQAASPLKIREVFPGSTAYGANAEYVVLQMTADGQSDIDGQSLLFYDSGGSLASSYTIPSDVANGGSQRTVLLATGEAVTAALASAPDFNIGSGTNRMDPSGGGVCLFGASPPDCVTWGSIPLFDPLSLSFPDPQSANAPAISDESALRRKITSGCPTYLDSADDTNNSSTNFAAVSPLPRNNATAPTETRCPPDTAISSAPQNPTNQTSATFAYAELPEEPGATFECKLDGGAFSSCPEAGKTYPGPLSEGPHTFQVKAIGEGGPDPSPKSHTWTIDTIAPETTILSFPPSPSGGFQATFTYKSSETPSSFRCQLDSGAIQVCSGSGKSYFALTDGTHLFRVWAKDNAGNEDPTPAEHVFTVEGILIDVSPPDTSIVSAPPNPSPSDSATFAYASTERGSSFECSLNGSPFRSCPPSGETFTKLRNADYTFAVRATDPAGNQDSVPATYSWEVKAPPPRTSFVKSPPGTVRTKGRKAKLLFSFKADKPNSSFRCRIDKRAFKPCKPKVSLKASIGKHRFEVYAIDELGNVEATPKRRIVRVQRKGKSGGLF